MSEGKVLLYETSIKPEWIDRNGHMNVDLEARKSAPFPDDVLQKLARFYRRTD